MDRRMASITMSLALGLAACGEPTLAPETDASTGPRLQAQPVNGTGLILNSLTGVSIPILGQIGEVLIDQAIITDLMLIEDLAGTIIGLEVNGIINGTLTATGVPIVEEEFTSSVGITSSGPGQCDLVTIDLGPLRIDGFGTRHCRCATGGADRTRLRRGRESALQFGTRAQRHRRRIDARRPGSRQRDQQPDLTLKARAAALRPSVTARPLRVGTR